MKACEVRGDDFLAGVGVYERSDNMQKHTLTQVRNGPQYKAWVCLRRPFVIPSGLTGHSCEEHWEKFDVDKAACTMCSNIHVCTARTCPSIAENDGFVCGVTGLFLGQCLMDQNEFVSTSDNGFRSESSNVVFSFVQDNPVNMSDLDSITRVLESILISAKTQSSIDSETLKMVNKMRAVGLRRMRQYRLMKRVPNLCDIDAHLHHMLCGHRPPPQSVASSLRERKDCINFAALSISRLICFMRAHCSNVPSCVKQGGVVIGMLYMMRSGVTIDNITVLARIPELKRFLPLEQHLPTFFNVRAKVVTEAENVIKYNMRGVNHRSLALLAQTQCITRSK
jgi:hypothetical protein